VVFISHCTEAREVNEDDFFKRGTTGGTIMSSALQMTKDIINKRYHPSSWNIYTFYSGDGENWTTDDEKTVNLFTELKDLNQMICYAEIDPMSHPESELSILTKSFRYSQSEQTNLWGKLTPIVGSGFKRVKLSKPAHIWSSFQHIFGAKK
tara:strand:- start:1473 stop:1925 length:453 start_codon:yes stop_codon:yes gene_type:complete